MQPMRIHLDCFGLQLIQISNFDSFIAIVASSVTFATFSVARYEKDVRVDEKEIQLRALTKAFLVSTRKNIKVLLCPILYQYCTKTSKYHCDMCAISELGCALLYL